MSKKKKRTKRYSGEDAKVQQAGSSEPVVHRYEAMKLSSAHASANGGTNENAW